MLKNCQNTTLLLLLFILPYINSCMLFFSQENACSIWCWQVPGNAKHSVLNVQFSVGMMFTAFPVLVLMYIWIVSFYVSLLKNKQQGQSEKMFQQYTLIDWIVVDNSLLIYFPLWDWRPLCRCQIIIKTKISKLRSSERGHLQPADQKELMKEVRILYNLHAW